MAANRPFRLDHIDLKIAREIRRLMISSYGEEARLLGAVDFPPSKRSVAHIRAARSVFYGFRHDGILAGVGELERDENDPANIASLAVDPRFFRMGIGTKLLRHIIAKSKGRAVTVSTARANRPAIDLYRKHGFKLMRKSKVEGKLIIVFLRRVPTAA